MSDLTSEGRLTPEQAKAFFDHVLSAAILPAARVAPMPGAEAGYLQAMRENPKDTPLYIRALAGAAGVKLRKARIFLGLDRGYITPRARALLERVVLVAKMPFEEPRRVPVGASDASARRGGEDK